MNFDIQNYSFELGFHRNKNVIWIVFPYNQNLIKALKNKAAAKWSKANKKWYVPDNKKYRKLFRLEISHYGKDALANIDPINQPAFNRFVEQLKLKAYSPNTIKTYSSEFAQLLQTLNQYSVDNLSADELRSYILYCIKKLKLSENLIHSRMNAIKFYFEQVLHKEHFFMDIPRPKKPSSLPKGLSTQDIEKMFSVMEHNIKHLLLLKLCYGMGLRVSEIVNLQLSDINSNRMQVLVHQSKGKNDRYINLPESVLELLQKYYLEYKPKIYLLEGQYGGQYSVRSCQAVFKMALEKAKITKKIGIHGLRHSYATRLIEQGTDMRFVQDLLRQANMKTTMIYPQITDASKQKTKSPLDNL